MLCSKWTTSYYCRGLWFLTCYVFEFSLLFYRETLNEYVNNVKFVMDVMYKAIAKSLNIDEDSFSSQLGDRSPMNVRVNFYPTCSRPDLVLGVKAHTDGSALTVLLQDKEMEGLQVLVDEKWITVPVLPHALVVNVGDQMQVKTLSFSI